MGAVRGSHRGRLAVCLAVLLTLAGLVVAPSARAGSSGYEPALLRVTGWPRLAAAPLAAAPLALPTPDAGDGIGPGSYLLIDQTDGNSYICTANFVWTGPGGERYLGAAGHCFLPADVEAAPANDPDRYVTGVQVCVSSCMFGGQLGATIRGRFVDLGPVAYARQARSGTDVGNDFGLVTIPAGIAVRNKVPVWGGPSGSASIGILSPVCIYGNATLFGEVFATKARTGLGSSRHGGAWYANIVSAPGDSGSAMVNCPGLTGTTAVGILTHLATDGTGVVAGTTVAQASTMVWADTGKTITLATA